jgi:predicted dehydrogenase
MFQVGIIGCGKQAPKHINAIKKIPGCKIVVADVSPEAAYNLAREHDVLASNDIEGLSHDKRIDIIDICTPTPTHFHYARQALLAGKHVLCEKPLTTEITEAEELVRLNREMGRVSMAAFVYKYHPRFVRIKEALDLGAIGTVRAIYMRLGGKGSHRAWKHQSDTGGGVVNEMMVHMLDLLLWYLGDLHILEAVNLDNLIKERQIDGQEVQSCAEDFAIVVGKSKSGTKVILQSDMISPNYTNNIEIIGSDGYIMASMLDTQPSYIHCNRERPPFVKGMNILANEKVDLFELIFRDFFKNIQGQQSSRKNTFEESLKLAYLINTIKNNNGVKLQNVCSN